MTDVAAALLHAMLDFAEQRLQSLEAGALQSASDLANAINPGGPAPTPVQAAQAESELTAARSSLAAFATGLSGSITLPTMQQATRDLGTGLDHVNDAIKAIASGSDVAALLKNEFTTAITATGLAAQLGLSVPNPPQYDGITLSYGVSTAAASTVAGSVPLHVESVALNAGLRLADGTFAVTVDLRGLGLSLNGSAYDSFLSDLLGAGALVSTDVRVAVDTQRGLTVAGAAGGPVTLPVRVSNPVLDVHALELELPASAPNSIDIGAQLSATLGSVLTFAVDGVGARVTIDADHLTTGAPLLISPKPPACLGTEIDAGPVRGGGYLAISGTTYSGLLDVAVGPVEARAFGILDTAADPGFSLIVVMTAEFDPAIEIALGFTLNGVGGVVGLQRATDTDALRMRLHDHGIDQLLFPHDPVAAAPQILHTLGDVFPARADSVVVGPMVKMGWGHPVSFVTASLGLILQLPDPKIVILGTFQLAVPSPDLPIVNLKGALYSEITPDHVVVRILLEDSVIAGLSVTGEVGVYLGLGADPGFAISAGGFHPQYQPPAELNDLRRLTIDMSPPVILTIRATAYVALTTNSFQLGGRLEAAGNIGPVSIHGFIQLDAILRWAPSFSFEVDLSAGFDMRFEGVSFAGVSLSLHLAGPRPWIIHGTATLEIPILPDIDVEVGPITWNREPNPPPPMISPRALVLEALNEPTAWAAKPPTGVGSVVTLRTTSDDPPLLAHPLAEFEGRQSRVPLETTITKVGADPVLPNENRVNLGQPTLTQQDVSVPFGAVSPVVDHFAPGQFLDLTDEEKLHRPAFEDMPAGIHLGPANGIRTIDTNDEATESDLHYDTVFPRMSFTTASREEFFPFTAYAVLAVGAAGRTPLRADTRYATKWDPIEFAPAAQVRIRSTTDLTAPPGLADEPLTYTAAADRLATLTDAAAYQLVALGTEAG